MNIPVKLDEDLFEKRGRGFFRKLQKNLKIFVRSPVGQYGRWMMVQQKHPVFFGSKNMKNFNMISKFSEKIASARFEKILILQKIHSSALLEFHEEIPR